MGGVFRRRFSFCVLVGLFAASVSAWAGPRLVVHLPVSIDSDHAVSYEMSRRLMKLTIQKQLSSRYEKIEWVESHSSTEFVDKLNALLADPANELDVMAADSDRGIALTPQSKGRIRWVLAPGEFSSDEKRKSWSQAERLIDVPYARDSFFYSIFFLTWARIWSRETSIERALTSVYWELERIADVLRVTDDWNATVRPQVLSRTHADFTVSGEYQGPKEAALKTAFNHPDFEWFSIQLAGALLVPGWQPQPEKVASASWLMQRVSQVSWQLIQPLAYDLPADGDDIIVDGDTLRYFFAPLRELVGPSLDLVLNEVQYAVLKRAPDHLEIKIVFNKSVDMVLQDSQKAPDFALYGVQIPDTIKFSVAFDEDTIEVKIKQPWSKLVKFMIKVPVLSDAIAFRGAKVNLVDGLAEFQLGMFRNVLGVAGKAQLVAKRLDGLDVWSSIVLNLKWLLPLLVILILL